jgi:hypothetical protein
MRRSLLFAALLATGCIPEDGPLMEPGEDCLECHGGSGGEEDGPAWSVAGTMGGQGSSVSVRDATGRSFTLHAARNGNFYSAESLQYPITVAVDGEEMPDPVPDILAPAGTCIDNRCCSGTRCGCNDCHGGGDGGGGGD